MTDKEIIKALECCLAKENCDVISCEKCPLEKQYECTDIMFRKTIDLINRQKAEIERLEKELMKCKLEKEMLYNLGTEIKTVAIKEFAERLKDRLTGIGRSTIYGNFEYGTIKSYEINNLVEEMTEVSE